MFNSLSVAGFGGGVANAFSPDSKVLGQSAASARETVKKLDDISMKNTWDYVTDMYEGVINEVGQRKGTARTR